MRRSVTRCLIVLGLIVSVGLFSLWVVSRNGPLWKWSQEYLSLKDSEGIERGKTEPWVIAIARSSLLIRWSALQFADDYGSTYPKTRNVTYRHGPSWCQFEWSDNTQWGIQDKQCLVTLGLWIPMLVIALPTAFLFWRERRRIPPGHCERCRYSLTGNTSGVCPECGTAVKSSK